MSAAPTQQMDLARDALQSIAAWPEHAPSWWHLTDCIGELANEAKTQVVAALRAMRFASPQAQWFQHSALHHVTGDIGCLARQAELAPQLPGAERWLSLANMVWWSALLAATDRDAFRQSILETGLPGLLDALGEGLGGAPRASELRPEIQRVGILAQHLSNGQHAPTALAFNVRAVLERAGIGTRIFAAQELDLPAMRGHTAGGSVASVAPLDANSWQVRTKGQVAITLADSRFSLNSRWRALETSIDHYDPDVLLFIGLFSPMVWPLRRRYPVLGLSVHSVPPLAPADVWLSAEARPDAAYDWPGLPRPTPVHFPFRFWPTTAPAVSRDEIGVPSNALLLMTCGSRLEPGTLADWIDEVVLFLDRHPQAEWLLVGASPAEGELLTGRHPRIRALPHRTDLAGWIAASDLYLNPPRLGGGASVAMAMQFGVPVVSLAGSDGGDKIEPNAVTSLEAYRCRLSEWAGDNALRTQEGERLKAKFRAELDISSPAAAVRLIDACRNAQLSFRRRQPFAAYRPVAQ